MATGQGASAAGPLVAERYRIEKPLGRGGMAAVFQAYDIAKQRTVALKRLVDPTLGESHVARLFEREYHTLSQLVHPRIIEVYDYHTDAQGPFYTMELLSGGDLRQRSPTPWREVCRLLCDVCSALALLHGRRLVHRDLTPLNIRCTGDERAKLFDFGSMVQFGRSKHLVGTPPFVAPEALHGQFLDGQADLFALGATAYYALTGRHAYPARTLAELPDLWRSTPAAPSQLVPEVPAALDELVMSLLSHAANARPPSAAEVMERLSVIGECPIQEALVVSAAYLSTPTLVGREDKLAAFSRQLKRAHEGRGTSIVVNGAAGTGRSRLLDACALEAKLGGALVLRADATDTRSEGWGAATTLCEQLYEQLPEQTASQLAPHAALLTPVMPELVARMRPDSANPPIETPPADANQNTRGELQGTLRQLMLTTAKQRPLVIVADDLERIDEPSAALLSLLAHESRSHQLLLIASVSGEIKARDQRALKLFTSVSDTIRLRNLEAAQAEELVISLFGDVAHVRWLADRMFGITRGNSLLLMRVAQHLVEIGACRYAGGTWTLPASLDPASLSAALQETLDPSLTAGALDFARMLALTDLPRVSLEQAVRLTSHGDAKRMQSELLELSSAEVVTLDDESVGLSRTGWKKLLLADVPIDVQRLMHLRISASCGTSLNEQFRLIQHLVQAGQVERALDLLLRDLDDNREARVGNTPGFFEYLQSLPENWPETFRTCIEACRKLNRPRRQLLALQTSFLGFSSLTARTERTCMLELAAQLRHDTGLDLIAEMNGKVPDNELLVKALTAAQERFAALPEHERGYPLLEALVQLGQLITQVIGAAGRTIDLSLLDAMPSLAPLRALSPALALVQKNMECSRDIMCGRSDRAHAGLLEIARSLEAPDGAGFQQVVRVNIHSAVLWAAGMIEANFGRPGAFARADAIQPNPLFSVSALRLRAVAALFRGDRARAEQARMQMELVQIQNSPPQLFEGSQVMQWVFGYAVIGDMLRVKQYLVDAEALAREYPGYEPILYVGRGAYQALRGDHVQSQREFERALAMMRVGAHPAWQFAAGSLVWALVRQDRNAEAVARGRELYEAMFPEQMEGNAYAVLVPLALAEARMGEVDLALKHLQIATDLLSADGGGGVLLGTAYEVRAQVAIIALDSAGFQKYAALCEGQYKIGGLPALLSRHEKLLRSARKAGVISGPNTADIESQPLSPENVQSAVSTVFGTAQGPEERAERALVLLGRASRCDSGYLYVMQKQGPVLVAQLGGVPPVVDMDAFATRFLLDAIDHRDVTQTESSSTLKSSAQWTITENKRFTPMLLSHSGERGLSVTGVAVMAMDSRASIRMPTRLLQALSKALYEAGDAVTEVSRDFERDLSD